MHPAAEHSPLGKSSEYIATYTPSLLFPIPRTAKWAELGLTAETLPYKGVDFWNCFELSWLLPSGKPVVAIGEFSIPADSPNIIESKSFKLYLNSLNQTPFADSATLEATLVKLLLRQHALSIQVLDASGLGLGLIGLDGGLGSQRDLLIKLGGDQGTIQLRERLACPDIGAGVDQDGGHAIAADFGANSSLFSWRKHP